MATFRVTWAIDVDADDVLTAARKARDYQRQPTAQVGVFDVAGESGATTVDLDAAAATDREQQPAAFPFRIESVRQLEEEESLLATVYVFGVLHHAWLVRVIEGDADQVAVDYPYGRFDEFRQLDSDAGRLQTVEVPGFPGDYVMVIYPAGQ